MVITASELRLDNAPTPVGDFLWRNVLNLGDIAPGEQKSTTFGGTVVFNVDNTEEISGFVSVDVSLSYDHAAYVADPISTRSMLHRIDSQPPSYVEITQPRTLLGLGVNQVRGIVHDESAISAIILQMQSPEGNLSTLDCSATVTEDGAWACDWDIGDEESPHNTADPYYENVRRPDHDVNLLSDQDAQGTWQLTICDHFSQVADNGFYNRSRLILSSDRLPANTQARWRYSLPGVASQDGVMRTLEVHGRDSVGNPNVPLSLTFQVDTVPPIITYTTHTAILRSGQPFSITGTVSDGGGVRAMQMNGITPRQTYVADVITLDYTSTGSGRSEATWVYTDTRKVTQPGDYTLWVNAIDDAGNRSTLGPFNVQVVESATIWQHIYLPLMMQGASSR